VKSSSFAGLLICLCLTAPLLAQTTEGPDVAKMEEELKAAADSELTLLPDVAGKLAPMLAELGQMRQKGSLTAPAVKIFHEALLLLIRTQTKLLVPEEKILPTLRDLLILDPKLSEGDFNPREKILIEKIRSAETGHLQVQSKPEAAALLYLGSELGATPVDMPLMAGTYRFLLRKEGYLDQEFDATIGPGQIRTMELALRRRSVEMPVMIGAAGVSISVNGQVVGTSQVYDRWLESVPVERRAEMEALVKGWSTDSSTDSFFRLAEVPVGETIALEFRAPCYEPLKMSLTVAERDVDWKRPVVVRPELKRVEMKRDTGFMEVTSVPAGAEVWLDGALQGKTPLSKDVCAGSHRIQILHRSGQYLTEVVVRRGQATKVSGELKPALAFLGIFEEKSAGAPLIALRPAWEAIARHLVLRSTAFMNVQLPIEDVESLRKKGSLSLEPLFQQGAAATDIDFLVKKIAAEVGKVDMLLIGARTNNRYALRLYSTLHPIPDVIDLPSLEEAALEFLTLQLNRAERIGERLKTPDLGIDLLDGTGGLVVMNVDSAPPESKSAIAPGIIVRTADRKPMDYRELQAYLRTKKPGETVTLEFAKEKEATATVPIPVRFAGAEYPWSMPDGFRNSVLTMLSHIVERDPLSDTAKFASLSLARGLMTFGEWKLALEVLARTNLEPHRTGVCPGTVLYYQGRCYEELGDRSQAEGYYTRARDFPNATIGTSAGLTVPALAGQRILSLKKPRQ
jgi:hypothetical protein